MTNLAWRCCLLGGLTTAVLTATACGADPIVFTERVPYEYEVWEQQHPPDAGTPEDPADAGSPGAPGSAAPMPPPQTPPKTSERTVFPPDNFWNKDISNEPVDPKGYKYVESIGLDTPLHADFSQTDTTAKKQGYGIPYQYVTADQKKTAVEFRWSEQSDPGPYPIPDNPLIEVGSDRHILMIDKDAWVLYELFNARLDGGKWKADSGAIFDLKSNKTRPAGWTSADAAGLAIFPGLVRADEVMDKKVIAHALRFTAKFTQRAYVYPASHFASDRFDPALPPLGIRARLKAGYKVEGFSPNIQVILNALKKYGMILADNGSNYYISGAPDPRWNNEELNELKRVKGRDLEVIKLGEVVFK